MKALLKPIVWVCLFFFAYQSTYAQALKIMSYNCRMSGGNDRLLGEGVCCIYQEIQSGCCNVARDRLQHKKE